MALLKELRYLTPDDVSTRIGNSIIHYKSIPVWSNYTPDSTTNHLGVALSDEYNDKSFGIVHSSDEDIDVRAKPLGYVNQGVNAVYAARVPSRRNNQGLGISNCVWIYNDQGGGRRTTPVTRGNLRSKQFFAMLHREYPNLEKCLSIIGTNKSVDKVRSIAFNRKLAIGEDDIGIIKLHYFATPIALFNKKRESFLLTERLEHYLPLLKSMDIPIELA